MEIMFIAIIAGFWVVGGKIADSIDALTRELHRQHNDETKGGR